MGNLLAPQGLQMISFIADLVPVHAIWMIESLRRGNVMTIVKLFVPFHPIPSTSKILTCPGLSYSPAATNSKVSV